MGLLDLLSAGLTPATQAATAQIQGGQDRQKADEDDALKMLAQLRQQGLDADKKAMDAATMGHLQAQTAALQHPAPPPTAPPGVGILQPDKSYKVEVEAKPTAPVMGSPEWLTAQEAAAKVRAKYATGPADQVTTLKNEQGVDVPVFVNPRTHAVTPVTGYLPKSPAAAGGGAISGALTSIPDLLRTNRVLTGYENDPNFQISAGAEAAEGGDYGVRHAEAKGTAPGVGSVIMKYGGRLMGGADAAQTDYLKALRAQGEDAANAWKGRTNEERVIRDITTGGMDSNTQNMPAVVGGIQDRRQNVIAMTAVANPAWYAKLNPQDRAEVDGYIARLPPDKTAAARAAILSGTTPDASGAAPTSLNTPAGKARLAQLKAQGVSKEQARATLQSEGYGVP